MKNRIWFALFFSVLILCTSCKQKDEKPSRTSISSISPPIRVAYVPYSSSLPAFVAAEKGAFAAKGITVKLIRFETSNESIAALAKGDIEALMGIGFPSLLAVEVKTPGMFKFIWFAVENSDHGVNALLVTPTSKMKGILDLRGKTVGTFSGATQLLNLQAIFKTAFGDVNAVKISQVSPNLQLQALQSGELAALFTIEPHVTIAVERGVGRVLVDNPRCKYILDPYPGGGGVIATKFLATRPADAKRLTEALDEAIFAIRADERAAKGFLPKYTPVEAGIAPKTRLYAWWTSTEIDNGLLQKAIDLLERDGILTGHVEAQNIRVQH